MAFLAGSKGQNITEGDFRSLSTKVANFTLLIICLHTIKWFKVLRCSSNNLTSVICLHTFKWRYIWFVRKHFVGNFIFNELKLICSYTSIAIVSPQLNGFNYCNVKQMTLFNINPLFALSEVVTSVPFQYYSFICTQSISSNGIIVRVFANDPGDLRSIPGRVIQKLKKWYLMPPCLTLSIIRIKGKVEHPRERRSALPYNLV